MSDVLDSFQRKARDHARVPMQVFELVVILRACLTLAHQWDATEHAGFTSGTPWMRVNDDYKQWNAASQVSDPRSVRSFWKEALRVRKTNDVLVSSLLLMNDIKLMISIQIYGDFLNMTNGDEQIFAYTRSLGNTTALVILNFKAEEIQFSLDDEQDWKAFTFVLGNYYHGVTSGMPTMSGNDIQLRGYEGRLYIRS
jgi:alpha-glucosidase